jgi:hypothetical protein
MASADSIVDDLRVDHRSTRCHPSDRVDEVGKVGHSVLEEVANAGRIVGQEPHRLAGLDMVREYEHCGRRVPGPQVHRGDETLVGVGGRHAHIDDCQVGCG